MQSALIIAATAVAIMAMLCFAATRALRGWLELKRLELAARSAPEECGGEDVGVRIELAAVRERLRKLEEIAAHVEL